MRSALLVLMVMLAGVVRGAPTVAIVLDDMGNNRVLGQQALALPGAITYSFLPGTPHTDSLSRAAHSLNKEVMVHLPMEALEENPLGPGALTAGMAFEELKHTIERNIQSVPHAAGANNHMGSLLTADPVRMEWLMQILSQRGEFYFLDSRTHDQTIAEQVAHQAGLPVTRRNLFLDNLRDEAHIEAQFGALIELAKQNGTAVAIGHPSKQTLAVLQRKLHELESIGVELVPVSALIRLQKQRNPSIVKLEHYKNSSY